MNNSFKSQHPYSLFGIECDEGWKRLYQPIIDYINKFNESHLDSIIEIHQIKEKFGGLRFYWGGENVPKEVEDELQHMIREAEAESYIVCEQCGKPAGTVFGGWYYTLCEDCVKEMAKINHRSYKWKDGDKIYMIDENGKVEYNQ